MAVFRGKMLGALRRAFARDALGLPEAMRPQQFFNLLNRLGHPTKTRWHVHIMERYAHGAGVVTYLARYLRGGPIKNARLVAWDGEHVTFTYRTRAQESASGGSARSRMTLSREAFLQRWLLHVPVSQSRVVRSYGLSHHTAAAALTRCRAQLGQPPVVVPVTLDWQTACAQRGDVHPERCPACGQRLVCTGVIPRGGAPPPALSGAHAARGTYPSTDLPGQWSVVGWPHGVVKWALGTSRGSQRMGDAPAVTASRAMGWANGSDDRVSAWHKLHSVRGPSGAGRIHTRSVQPSAIRSAQGRACVHRGALSPEHSR